MSSMRTHLIVLGALLSLTTSMAKAADFAVDHAPMPTHLTIDGASFCDTCSNYNYIFNAKEGLALKLKANGFLPGCKVSVTDGAAIFSTTSYSSNQCGEIVDTFKSVSSSTPGYVILDANTAKIVKIGAKLQ